MAMTSFIVGMFVSAAVLLDLGTLLGCGLGELQHSSPRHRQARQPTRSRKHLGGC
jgi:hypothetical protein